MGRPLYPYYIKDITVHCYEEDNGSRLSRNKKNKRKKLNIFSKKK